MDYRLDSPEELAAAFHAQQDIRLGGGMLVTNPIPEVYSMDPQRINAAIDTAVTDARLTALTAQALASLR